MSGAIRTVIVDDEPLAREGLRRRLDAEPDVEVLRECGSGKQAIAAIDELQPDLVFLDVQMPAIDGFGVLAAVGPQLVPAVVFVTAHDEHAVRAFEVHAVDYLLKPIDDERFVSAMEHVRATLRQRRPAELAEKLQALAASLEAKTKGYLERLAVKSGDRIQFVGVDEIDWIEAADNDVRVHAGSREHLVHEGLSGVLAKLDPRTFVRIHRSTVVNVRRVSELRPLVHGGYRVGLTSGAVLTSGRRYRAAIESLIGKAARA